MSWFGNNVHGGSLALAFQFSGSVTGSPTYSVYKEDTAAAVDTGTLTEDANIAGLCSDTVTLSTANGYDADKRYVVVATATVAGSAETLYGSFAINGSLTGLDIEEAVRAILHDEHSEKTWTPEKMLRMINDAQRIVGLNRANLRWASDGSANAITNLAALSETLCIDTAGKMTIAYLIAARCFEEEGDANHNLELGKYYRALAERDLG